MSWTVFLRKAAEDDIDAARSRYDAERPGLGGEFLDEVATVINAVSDNPERPPIYYRGFRRILMRRFPYKIFYLLDKPRVIVFRVLHGKQDHPRWLPK
jgi:plasmid stabilization system protein ParE